MPYGLALEGGGARGAFHIGVWRALREMKIQIAAVTGTSIGALNGALFVSDDFDAACRLWETVETKDIVQMDAQLLQQVIAKKTKLGSMEAYMALLKYILENKGLNIAPLKRMIRKHIDEDRLRKAEMDFGFVTVSLTEKKPLEVYLEDVPRGKVCDYLLASAYLPVFQAENLDGGRFIDGAFFDNLPIRLLVRKGYRKIIAVHLNSLGLRQRVAEKGVEILHIYPSGELGGTLFFHPIQSRQNMQMGYLDTLKAFGCVRGNRYYLDHVPDEEEIFRLWFDLPKSLIRRLGEIQGRSVRNERRFLFEFLLPQLAELLDVLEEADYQFLYLTLLEYGADTIGLYRLKRYDYTYFRQLVLLKFCAYREGEGLARLNKKETVLYHWLRIFLETERGRAAAD